MDRILTRPAHNLFQILLENVDPPALVGSFIGLIIMIFSGAEMGLVLEWWHIPALIILALSSVLIYGDIYTDVAILLFGCSDRYSSIDVQHSGLWTLSGNDL